MDANKLFEIICAVNNIAEDIYESTEEIEYFNLIMETDGFVCNVMFIGIRIWCSEDDDREFNEFTDKYEPIEGYLRQKINEELVKLQTIKV